MSRSGQAALAAVFIISSQPLRADVTPDEVWLSWQNMALAQGQKLTADSTETDSDTLTITGLTLTLGDGGSATMEQIDLTDNGDGTVDIAVPESFPVHLILPKGTEATQTTVDLTVSDPGAAITASGVPESINYEKHLPRLEIVAKGQSGPMQIEVTLKAVEVKGKYLAEAGESGQNLTGEFSAQSLDLTAGAKGGEAGSDIDVKLSLSDPGGKLQLTGLPADSKIELDAALDAGLTFDGSLTYGIGSLDISGTDAGKPMKLAGTLGGGSMAMALDAAKFHYDINNRAISLNLAGTDQASGGDFTFVGSMADLTNMLDINGRGWSKSGDFGAALKAGLVMAASAGLGSTNFDFSGGPADKPVKIKASLASVSTDFTLASSQLTYDFGSKALSVTVVSPEIPVPEVTLDVGEVAVGLVMPVAKSDKPAPFTYLTKIVDLKLPEALWSMFDPGGSLSHDPATLIINTKGTATMTKDLMDDATALKNGATTAPGILNSLEIPQIVARALGAEVTAKGAFTFDASDMATIPDMPMPTGKIDIRATGLNSLVDKLVAMGLLPQDQAMQGKIMMSMFALNDMTKDEITTVLEFKDKHFFANGAQLQ